jgi:hypothetical protein
MSYVLVVLKPFQGFRRGDRLEDAALIEKILAGDNASFVVRVNAGKE